MLILGTRWSFARSLLYSIDSYRKKNTPLTLVVNLDVPDQVILSRISDRWVHLPSGRVYNLSYNPPKVKGRDDQTGELLTKRPDDNPVRQSLQDLHHFHLDLFVQETFSRRLARFYTSTSPLISYYTTSSTLSSSGMHNPHQHPHQVSFHRPPQRLKLRTLTGVTSDENWSLLDRLVRTAFPDLKERLDPQRSKASDLNKAMRSGTAIEVPGAFRTGI